jgi:hypothetical protein
MNIMKSDTRKLFKEKIRAASIHLGISLLIFLGIFYVILFEWYPEPFFTAEGGWDGIKLMAAVDLVLGPSLTFIIFNYAKAKKEILFDLSLIAIVQVSALLWGGLQVYSERPVALVMWEGVFYTVTEDYYQKQGVSLKDIATFSDEQPLVIYAETDHSVEQLNEIKRLNEQKIPPYAQVHLYHSLKDNLDKVLSHQLLDQQLLVNLKYKNLQIDAETELYAFLGRAKYKTLGITLNAEGDLVEITSAQ